MSVYVSPLVERYSSRAMAELFSAERRFGTWRRLWVALAEAERALGLPITRGQVDELKRKADDLNLTVAARYEKKLRHDVMAHIRAYGDQCPKARPIIHLGATSMYVVDNTDLILVREALTLLRDSLVSVLRSLAGFAQKNAGLPTVAYTHFQPAQFTTVGKRACLWAQDLLIDLDELDRRQAGLRFLGAKGATGTQASFLALFDGDERKVEELDRRVAAAFGFRSSWPATGQTYSRKVDSQIHSLLSGIAESSHKFSNDLRLLQHLGEVREPFEEKQVGSSAMAYKRNPVRSERMASLSRLVITLGQNAAFTAASQWFERTLDDSAGKRIATPEAFLATDAVLQLYQDIASRLQVDAGRIRRNVEREIPSVATENLLMEAVKAGGDRQDLHERIRTHAMKSDGEGAELLRLLSGDPAFRKLRARLPELLKPERYIGRCSSQVRSFLRRDLLPRVRGGSGSRKAEIRV